MEDTVIETVATVATETEDTVDDHERRTREKDSTRATVTKRILASCGGIKVQQDTFRFVLWWVSRVFSLSSLLHQG